jgi:hypothetical protein
MLSKKRKCHKNTSITFWKLLIKVNFHIIVMFYLNRNIWFDSIKKWMEAVKENKKYCIKIFILQWRLDSTKYLHVLSDIRSLNPLLVKKNIISTKKINRMKMKMKMKFLSHLQQRKPKRKNLRLLNFHPNCLAKNHPKMFKKQRM